MAVTLTVAQLAAAMRLGSTTQETAEVTRLLAYSTRAVTRHAATAPDEIHDEAIIRLASYLFDQPNAGRGMAYANAMRNSGAGAILLPYRVHRAGSVSAAEAAPDGMAGSADNPVTDVNVSGSTLTVTYKDGTSATRNLPSGGPGGPAIDATARAAAGANARVIQTIVADDWVTSRRIAAEAVSTGHIANAAIDSRKIGVEEIINRHLSADIIGNAEMLPNAIGTTEVRDDAITEPKLSAAVRTKLNASRGGSGDDAASWAEQGNTAVIPKAKIPHYLTVYPSVNPATIQSNVAGEKDQDLVIGYSASTIAIFRFSTSANAFQMVASWPRTGGGAGRSDSDLETFIERIVSAWAIQGNADGIPGAKTFDGLFKSEAQTAIPGANVTIVFDVGDATDGDVVDETDAAASNFAISEEQAAEPAAFLRCRYSLQRLTLDGFAPQDIELQLQTTAGVILGKHNIKDEGAGAAQFPVGDAGQHRWAVRVVTKGRYQGDLIITETEYHSAQPLADKPMEHVAEAAVSVEAEKRQAEDARLTTEIARVEGIKAIVNGLPSPTRTRKTAIVWKNAPAAYEQADSDAFVVPPSGFVQFLGGNLFVTPIMRAEDCINRQMTGLYTFGRDNVGIEFDSARRAILIAQRSSDRSPLANDIANTTTGWVMLHWPTARESGHAEDELASLETRVEALEARPGGSDVEVLAEHAPEITVPGSSSWAAIPSPGFSHTLAVTKDRPVQLGITVEQITSVDNRSVEMSFSLESAARTDDTAAGEYVGNTYFAENPSRNTWHRMSNAVLLWPHQTGNITIHFVARTSGSATRKIRNLKLLKL